MPGVRAGKIDSVEGRAVLASYKWLEDSCGSKSRHLYAYSTGRRLFSRESGSDDVEWMNQRLALLHTTHERLKSLGCEMDGVGDWSIRIREKEFCFAIFEDSGHIYRFRWRMLTSFIPCQIEELYTEAVRCIRDSLTVEEMSRIDKRLLEKLVRG